MPFCTHIPCTFTMPSPVLCIHLLLLTPPISSPVPLPSSHMIYHSCLLDWMPFGILSKDGSVTLLEPVHFPMIETYYFNSILFFRVFFHTIRRDNKKSPRNEVLRTKRYTTNTRIHRQYHGGKGVFAIANTFSIMRQPTILLYAHGCGQHHIHCRVLARQ